MRIRYKPWARAELEESSFYIKDPEHYQGKWRNTYERPSQPLYLELGCGKGKFIAQMSVNHPEINYLAIDIVDPMLGVAKRTVEEVYQNENKPIDHLYLVRYDIEMIGKILNKEDDIERIYINFCNPWPRGKHRKKRLTHSIQLEKYKTFLKEGVEIYFKTDDDLLFQDSLRYFTRSGFTIKKQTEDLENDLDFWENIQTEHEAMFKKQGIKIKAAIATLE